MGKASPQNDLLSTRDFLTPPPGNASNLRGRSIPTGQKITLGPGLGVLVPNPGAEAHCIPGPSRLGAKQRKDGVFTAGGCKLPFWESCSADFPAALGWGERPPAGEAARKASICNFLGGKDSELNCLSLLTDAGSCG